METDKATTLDTKRIYLYGVSILGLFLLLSPLVFSFLSFFGGFNAATSTPVPGLTLSLMLPFAISEKSRKNRVRIFLYSILPLSLCWIFGIGITVIAREYTVDWLQLVFNLMMIWLLAIPFGLFMIWLTSQPTPKQSQETKVE